MARRVFTSVEDRARGLSGSPGSALWDVPKGIEPAHCIQAKEPGIVPTGRKINVSPIVLHFRQTGILVESEPQAVGG